MRSPINLTAALLVASAVACADATAPTTTTRAPSPGAHASVDAYIEIQPVNGEMRDGQGKSWGHFQLVFMPASACLSDGICHPPSPCQGASVLSAPDGYTAVAVCAAIFNTGGETFTSGSLLQVGTTDAASVLTIGAPGAFPPNPCRSYTVQGVVYLADATASQLRTSPAAYRLSFASVARPISALSGALDGSTTGAVGPMAETDVWFAYNKCTVNVTATPSLDGV